MNIMKVVVPHSLIFFGDKYYFFMEPLQEATYASEIVIYANTDADRFLSIGAGLGFPDDNKSY